MQLSDGALGRILYDVWNGDGSLKFWNSSLLPLYELRVCCMCVTDMLHIMEEKSVLMCECLSKRLSIIGWLVGLQKTIHTE